MPLFRSRKNQQLRQFITHEMRLRNALLLPANRVVQHIQRVMHSAAQQGLSNDLRARLKNEANRVWYQSMHNRNTRRRSPSPIRRHNSRSRSNLEANRLVRNTVATVVRNQRRRQQAETDLANMFSRLNRLSWRR